VHDDVKIGDVVVPDLVIAYDKTSKVCPTLDAAGKPMPDDWEVDLRADAFRTTHELVEVAKALEHAHAEVYAQWRERGKAEFEAIRRRNADAIGALLGLRKSPLCAEPGVWVETLASGHAVVAAEAFAKWVRAGNADLKALEMEAAGMLLAAEKRVAKLCKLVIRGISDHSVVDKQRTEAIEAIAVVSSGSLLGRSGWRDCSIPASHVCCASVRNTARICSS
jgi:nucleoside phosphorylase